MLSALQDSSIGNVNVNVQPFAGGLVAMTEAPKQALIDAGSLAVKSWLHYDDPLGAVSMTAHPVLDQEAGLVVNMAQVFSSRFFFFLFIFILA